MSSFFSRKRHTAQPAPNPTPAPAPAPNPPPAVVPSNQGSYGRSNVPPQAQQRPSQRGPPEQASTPTSADVPGRPIQQLAAQPPSQQQAPTQQTLQGQSTPQQQPPPGASQAPTSGSGGGSSRPRQDYPWSVRRLRVETPLALPGPPGQPSVTSMTGPPLPRYGHSVPLIAAPNGEIFVFGGLVKDEVKDDLWMIAGAWSPDASVDTKGRRSTKDMGVTASLVETTGDAPGPRVGHKSALVSSVLIVWGGDTVAKDDDRNDDGLYLLNLSTRDWTKVSIVGQAPLGRYGHAVGMCGNKFMMFGGQVDGEFLNDLWCFDLQSLVRGTSGWEQLMPIPGNEPPPRRTGHVLVTYENKIYIFGGTDGAFHYNDTWVFDLATRTWTELTCIGFIPVPREGHAAALVGDVMYVFGGRGVDGKDLGDLGSFKIGNQRWYMFQNMGPQPSGRSGHAMATADGRMFVIGGESGEPSAKDDSMMVHVLDTNLIKYPESKPPPNQAARRPNGAPASTAPNGGAPPPASTGPPQLDTRRGQGSVEGSQRGPSSAEGGPRASSGAGQNGSSSPEEYRRGAQSADEHRRAPEEPRRGAQSVDEPRRAGAEEAWRQAQSQGMPEELRRVQEEGRRGQGTPEDARRMGSTPDEARRLGGTPEDARRVVGTPDEARRLQDDRRSQGQPSPDEARRLAASPPVGRVRSPNGGSIGQSQSLGVAAVGAVVGASPPRESAPPRPPRRSDVESTDDTILDRARSPPSQTQPQAQDPAERARSPQERARSPAEALRAKSPINMAAVALRGQGGAPGSRSGSPADVFGSGGSPREVNGYGGHGRSASAVSARGVGASSVIAPGDELETLRRRDAWMRAALARAANAGFVWTDPEGDLEGDWTLQGQGDDASARLADLVVGLKQNQARLQTTFAAQLQSASDRLIEADRVKTAALQEAAFCRAKLVAYESNIEGDPAKLERDRMENLERLLSAASSERVALERALAERTEALALQTQLREQAEEQAVETTRRAEMAEEDKERTLAGHADLMDRNVFLESSMRDHAEKIVAVQSGAKQGDAEHAATLQKLDEALALRDEHLRALEQTQTALAATSARADDLERQWDRSRQLIQALEAEQADMRAEIEQRTQEAQSAVKHLEEVENAWAKSRQEADAHRHATTSSLGTILDSHKELRMDEDRATRGHSEKVHAMEMELSSLRKMLKEAGNRIGESQSDVVVHQKKAGAALSDAAALRAQLGGLRAQLAASVAEHGRLKQELAMKEAAVRERASAASSAEVRLGMLRKYLVDNGIVVDEEDINSDNESRGGTIRVQQLENELRERLRLHQDTERELHEARRRRDDAEAQVQHLAQQLERAKSATSPSEPDTEGRVASAERRREETETRLSKRIQELDNDYQMAVKYVKGTEKMMRRMKEDYAKSKALNEKLQSELDVSRGITSSEAGSRTRGATGRNTPLSDEGHDPLRSQLVESQRSLQRLTVDRNELKRQLEALQHDLEQSREDLVIAQNESSEREVQIEELEARIEELQHSLNLARNGSDETVVERLTSENAALRREKDLLSHKVHILLDDQGGYGQEGRPMSGISRRDSQTSTENGMTQFDSFEDWQQRVNSRSSTNPRDSEYEPSTSHAPHERVRSGA